MRLPRATLQAMAAGDVHLGGDEVAGTDVGNALANGDDGAGKFVAGDVGRLDAVLRPSVPLKNM